VVASCSLPQPLQHASDDYSHRLHFAVVRLYCSTRFSCVFLHCCCINRNGHGKIVLKSHGNFELGADAKHKRRKKIFFIQLHKCVFVAGLKLLISQVVEQKKGALLEKMVFGSVMPRPARWSSSVRVRLRVVLMKHALMI
jgi:hypothetical protein